jgi:nuclear pore complex protein Nup133
MFSQEDEKGYLDKFFVEQPNPAISWLDDIGKGRFDAASGALLSEAQSASNLKSKHVGSQINVLVCTPRIFPDLSYFFS